MQCKCNVKLAVILFIIIKGYTVAAPLYTSFKHAAREIYTRVVNSVPDFFWLSSEFWFVLAVVILLCFHQIKRVVLFSRNGSW
jgi:hypothetical protein